jgi:hypothetical protein
VPDGSAVALDMGVQLWLAAPCDVVVQGPDNPFGRHRKVGRDTHALAVEVAQNVQQQELPPVRRSVGDGAGQLSAPVGASLHQIAPSHLRHPGVELNSTLADEASYRR